MNFRMALMAASAASLFALGACDSVESVAPATPVASAPAPAAQAGPARGKYLVASPSQNGRIEDARDVKEVVFGKGDQRLTESAPGVWHEFNASSIDIATLRVTSATKAALDLKDENGKRVLRLDGAKKVIFKSENDGPMVDWKAIESSTTGPILTGRNLTHAAFGEEKAHFEQSNLKEWTEYSGDGQAMGKFAETARDDWSVYLAAEGGKTIQLDTYRRVIKLGLNGAAAKDWWRLTDAESPMVAIAGPVRLERAPAQDASAPDGLTVKSVTFDGGKARLMNSDPNNGWVELHGNAVFARFAQESRTATTVRLYDQSRQMRIEIDITRKMLRLESPGAPMADYLPIEAASRSAGNG
ncbi:MAG TPA: hypothetical protein VGO52_20350 [Hyphomonadaceae bacterium]|nr:hypothetical protein [Hyphomonadaceae bacterium]